MKKIKTFEENSKLYSRINSIAKHETKDEDLNTFYSEVYMMIGDLNRKYGKDYIAQDIKKTLDALIDFTLKYESDRDAYLSEEDYERNVRLGNIKNN